MSSTNRAKLTAAALLPLLVACSGLSKEAKQMTGDYYIDEVSPDIPVMELRKDGTVIQHAILPGVLSYSVRGKWNVKNDSLIITNEPRPFEFEGDSTLIGEIPARMSKAVVSFNGLTLTLRHNGADYVYYRRGHRE